MIYQIQNDVLSVKVNDKGAELWSIRSKKTDVEYLWQGDTAFWGGRAYNLFPFIGRMPENYYRYAGKTYDTRTHGLARYFVFDLESQTENTLVFSFKDNEETKKEYPFSFIFRVIFQLDGEKLTVRYEATNTDTREMICAFGGHPGINIPFGKGAFEDYYLDFGAPSTPEQQLLDASDRFMANKTAPYPLTDGTKLPLRHGLFDHDAIILQNTTGCVSVRSTKEDRYVTIHYEEYPFIGFWQVKEENAPNAPYLCLEPWSALPGISEQIVDLETKPHMTRVPVGEKKTISFTLEIHE